ncbi:Aste57867_16695 [Aphanomyces stellatus]|uniref:Aste57867_16695 protein n=1 Tax=Aphanomyces stellatus TaxID=120398 RepID=A0A485L624_9STRA|nr:hypothetical protein As57867_016638 [Aphanomyces stellatus]VFT93465.1 Aste57867_16695 [Aphanomyces stellatus]
MYRRLLEYESDYIAGDHKLSNYTHWMVQYRILQNKPVWKPIFKTKKSLKSIFSRCPHSNCRGQLPLALVFSMHVDDSSIFCPHCSATLNYRMFQLGEMLAANPRGLQWSASGRPIMLALPAIPRDGCVEAFQAALVHTVSSLTTDDSVQTPLLDVANATLDAFLNRCLGSFDFDVVLMMLHDLSNMIEWGSMVATCANFEYWSRPQIIQAAIVRYHKFMELNKLCDRTLVRTHDISLVETMQCAFGQEYRAYLSKLFGMAYAFDASDFDEPAPVSIETTAARAADTYLEWASHYDEAYLPLDHRNHLRAM